MSNRIRLYKPLKPGYDPLSLGTKETFNSEEGYEIFEDRGDVLVFRLNAINTSGGIPVLGGAKFSSHGMCVLEDPAPLYADYMKKHPRKQAAEK